jgi:hypothetical protein
MDLMEKVFTDTTLGDVDDTRIATSLVRLVRQ